MLLLPLLPKHHSRTPSLVLLRRFAYRKATKIKPPPTPPAPPTPPKPPKKPVPVSLHGVTWHDPYSWMSDLHDRVAMRHMDVHMEQEERYTDAVMASTERLQSKLQSEMSVRMASYLSSPPVKWGPWLYYRRVEEGKQYPVLCRRSASLHEEFVSFSSPSSGFDYDSGRRIEQKILDYNREAERFGGYAFEERSEVSPDHRFLAYTMYDKDKDAYVLSVRDLTTGSLCEKPRADRVSQLAWAMDGKALIFTVRDNSMRPYQIFCSFIGSNKDNALLLEEPDKAVYVNIRNTKDFQFITVNICSGTSSKVYLINAADPLSELMLVWEFDGHADCIVEHHRGHLYLFTDAASDGFSCDSHHLLHSSIEVSGPRNWENVITEEQGITIEDIDFCDTHMVIILKKGKEYKLCSVSLPLHPDGNGAMPLINLQPCFLPLPKHVCRIAPGPNYDYYSSTMRFTISSPVMPDAVVDYNLFNGKCSIVQQQNLLYERTLTLYGASAAKKRGKSPVIQTSIKSDDVDATDNSWNDLSEFYACESYDVPSKDGVLIPMTIVYSRKQKQEGNPGLLHGHGAYGEILDKRWQSELKSLLDRGWVIAYADVRGGGGSGKKWYHEGRRSKKHNSIMDYISCANFLVNERIVEDNKLAGWGYSAGGLLVASAINNSPNLFRAAVLKVPFLDPCSTLLNPVLPLNPLDYDEFGCPENFEDFEAIRKYSPYDNIQKDTLYPAILVTSSFNTRFGVWEAAKWVAKIRDQNVYDPQHPILLNVTMDMVEENKYLQSKEFALETAFLIEMVTGS